ncbi:hypothetical protein FA15DRAFT_655081 [Coprinopsis marcescibilis]|uniref:Mtf2-like C-terminal domain-containing protein n=1 Tax=Coprinopsis marcescibilis TaxID=230819 RepID=A0A5C3KZ31_COPMA|nr:hypothetical protein FA15DRAFT_655081 [Coprinopsis marcescibilis]
MSTGPSDSKSRSIFSKGESSWDHLFDDIDDRPPAASAPQQQGSRKHSMTEAEKKILRELLDQVFIARQEQSQEKGQLAKELYEKTHDPSQPYTRLRASKAPAGEKSQSDVAVDELQEDMDKCANKAELLQWARQNVFNEPVEHTNTVSTLPLPIYSRMIPRLMAQFRERFKDPELALFVYKYTRNHSITSFVYGCMTSTYNELLLILWNHYRDLQGIQDILADMEANSVGGDRRTEMIVERACREAAEGKLWLDRSPEGDQLALVEISRISESLLRLLSMSGPGYMGGKKDDWKLKIANESKSKQGKFGKW